jgi:hypothetical protein
MVTGSIVFPDSIARPIAFGHFLFALSNIAAQPALQALLG